MFTPFASFNPIMQFYNTLGGNWSTRSTFTTPVIDLFIVPGTTTIIATDYAKIKKFDYTSTADAPMTDIGDHSTFSPEYLISEIANGDPSNFRKIVISVDNDSNVCVHKYNDPIVRLRDFK